MMKARISEIDGTLSGEMELPMVFNTPIREDIIHKSYVNLLSHNFQKQGRYPNAGEVVSAESRNTGQGIARIARARGEGFPRAGQAGGSCRRKTWESSAPSRIVEKHLQENK